MVFSEACLSHDQVVVVAGRNIMLFMLHRDPSYAIELDPDDEVSYHQCVYDTYINLKSRVYYDIS